MNLGANYYFENSCLMFSIRHRKCPRLLTPDCDRASQQRPADNIGRFEYNGGEFVYLTIYLGQSLTLQVRSKVLFPGAIVFR